MAPATKAAAAPAAPAAPKDDPTSGLMNPGDEVDGEDDLPGIEGDLIDLEPTLRDAVVLSLPLAPVCDEDCPGLCPECGVRLVENPSAPWAIASSTCLAMSAMSSAVAGSLAAPRSPIT
mgnify:CR=1 FL=1